MALRIEDAIARTGLASFMLPAALEAREPAEVRGAGRDDVRLLVTSGPDGDAVHARFTDLQTFLRPGDLIVLNASATVPSALWATTPAGDRLRLHVSTRLHGGACVVEAREHGPLPGDTATLDGGAVLTFVGPYRDSRRLWVARIDGAGDLIEYLYRFGEPIAYKHVTREWPIEAYQTVYAEEAGSAEMTSAGRPFTHEMLRRLRENGVDVATIVLHTGVSSPERDESPYEEFFRVPSVTVERVEHARERGGRVIAVGTTVVRALESAIDGRAALQASSGWTDLIILPRRGVRVADGMITGFHEPRSTHIAMLEGLAGRRHVANAYASALEGRYLWHEFGDSHLLLP